MEGSICDSIHPPQDNYLTAYLNRPEVKEALHVKGDIEWVECSTTTRYNVQDLLIPMEVRKASSSIVGSSATGLIG